MVFRAARAQSCLATNFAPMMQHGAHPKRRSIAALQNPSAYATRALTGIRPFRYRLAVFGVANFPAQRG